MGVWSSSAKFEGETSELLSVLTDVSSITEWSPVPFDVEHDTGTLRPGDTARVAGSLLGRSVRFELGVAQADDEGLSLRARGPFDIHVDYDFDPVASSVHARVETQARGPLARMLAVGAGTLLAAGALDRCLARVVAEAESRSAALAA